MSRSITEIKPDNNEEQNRHSEDSKRNNTKARKLWKGSLKEKQVLTHKNINNI